MAYFNVTALTILIGFSVVAAESWIEEPAGDPPAGHLARGGSGRWA